MGNTGPAADSLIAHVARELWSGLEERRLGEQDVLQPLANVMPRYRTHTLSPHQRSQEAFSLPCLVLGQQHTKPWLWLLCSSVYPCPAPMLQAAGTQSQGWGWGAGSRAAVSWERVLLNDPCMWNRSVECGVCAGVQRLSGTVEAAGCERL